MLRRGQVVSQAKLEQVFMADGVRRIAVGDGPLRGALFLPPGTVAHPGVLLAAESSKWDLLVQAIGGIMKPGSGAAT